MFDEFNIIRKEIKETYFWINNLDNLGAIYPVHKDEFTDLLKKLKVEYDNVLAVRDEEESQNEEIDEQFTEACRFYNDCILKFYEWNKKGRMSSIKDLPQYKEDVQSYEKRIADLKKEIKAISGEENDDDEKIANELLINKKRELIESFENDIDGLKEAMKNLENELIADEHNFPFEPDPTQECASEVEPEKDEKDLHTLHAEVAAIIQESGVNTDATNAFLKQQSVLTRSQSENALNVTEGPEQLPRSKTT